MKSFPMLDERTQHVIIRCKCRIFEWRTQTHQALKNLGAVLEAAGVGYEDVVRTMVFLDNMDDFATVNAIYAEYFKESAPARSCVEVARLPKGGLIEIEAIAAK